MTDQALIRRSNLCRWVESPTALTQKIGGQPSYASDLMRGAKSFGEKAARRIEDAFGWLPGSLDDVNERTRPPLRSAVAHAMSLDELQTVPSSTWEHIKMLAAGGLPRVFRLPIESAEMEPRVRRGAWVQFASHLADDAMPGDGVLVKDATGEMHFRVYKAGKPGTWEAHAANDNFEPLFSDRDGLEILAVLTAVEGRWS
jgi:hypothetical protein